MGTGALVAQERGCQATAKRIRLSLCSWGGGAPDFNIYTLPLAKALLFWTAGRDNVFHGALGALCPGAAGVAATGPWRRTTLSPMLSWPPAVCALRRGLAKFSHWLRAGGPPAVMVKLQALGLLLGPNDRHKGLCLLCLAEVREGPSLGSSFPNTSSVASFT